MEKNNQKYIIYLKEHGKIVLTDKKNKLTKEYIKEISNAINSNNICKFETSDDILLLKPSSIVGVHICKNVYNSCTKKDSIISDDIEKDGFDILNQNNDLNILNDNNDINTEEENNIEDYLENEEVNISKELSKLEDNEEIIEPEFDFELNLNDNKLNTLSTIDIKMDSDNDNNNEFEKKLKEETNIKKKSNKKITKNGEKTKLIEGVEIKKTEDLYDKNGNKIYDMDFPEEDPNDDIGEIL